MPRGKAKSMMGSPKIKGVIETTMPPTRFPIRGERISEVLMEQMDVVLKVEQYINDQVAADVYKKFGVGIRVHITG